jgi:AhpC/TSA family
MAQDKVDIIYGESVSKSIAADVKGDALWLDAEAMRRVAGWQLKPDGFCKGETCIPVPSSRKAQFVSGDRFNLAALAQLLGQPLIHDQEHRVWCFGEAAAERKRKLTSLEAPDFELPDLSGKTHRLSDHRGKKVFLVSWASW